MNLSYYNSECFNPCSYGSFVLTQLLIKMLWRFTKVSILVLMDLSFLLHYRKCDKRRNEEVSILVLMDLSFLQGLSKNVSSWKKGSFNPCSYGSFVLTGKLK